MTLKFNCTPRFEIFFSQIHISISGQQTHFCGLRIFFQTSDISAGEPYAVPLRSAPQFVCVRLILILLVGKVSVDRSLHMRGSHNPYPTAFPYGNGMVLHSYQQQESSTTKTVHKVINKGLKAYV